MKTHHHEPRPDNGPARADVAISEKERAEYDALYATVELETVDLVPAPVDLDPIVMDIDGPDDEKIDIPDGWDLFPGGVERTIGVNQDWIRLFMGRPWRIELAPRGPDGRAKFLENVEEFRILGESRAVAVETMEQVYDCGVYSTRPRRAARVATSAPILFRR